MKLTPDPGKLAACPFLRQPGATYTLVSAR